MMASRVLSLLTLLGLASAATAVDLAKIERKIVKEPAYRSRPKYCLLVFGPEARTRVWLVQDDAFTGLALSPDGQTLAVLNWVSEERKLFRFSMAHRHLLGTTLLGKKPKGQRLIASGCTFSPDGKWLVVITRLYPDKRGEDMDPRDLPQPRIHLIEAATGTIRETLIAPQSSSNNACFSPDGRTLATDGHGRVLLWDMTKLP
jgi:WD40 repeat protein